MAAVFDRFCRLLNKVTSQFKSKQLHAVRFISDTTRAATMTLVSDRGRFAEAEVQLRAQQTPWLPVHVSHQHWHWSQVQRHPSTAQTHPGSDVTLTSATTLNFPDLVPGQTFRRHHRELEVGEA